MLWSLSFQCSWMDFVEESFYLWHSDITTAARHYLIWAYTQLSCLLISSQWPCTTWCPYMEIICRAHRQWGHFWKSKHSLGGWVFHEEPRMPSVWSPQWAGSCFRGWGLQWTHFRLISELFYTQRSREGGNSPERANIWKIFCSSEQRRSLLGKSSWAEVWEIHSTFSSPFFSFLWKYFIGNSNACLLANIWKNFLLIIKAADALSHVLTAASKFLWAYNVKFYSTTHVHYDPMNIKLQTYMQLL